jgi:hypothetical protein
MPLRWLVVAAILVALAGCGPGPGGRSDVVAMPPDTASPLEVLGAYLGAMRNGDCPTAHRLFVEPIGVRNGDLCGAVTLFSYRLTGNPLPHGATEIIYGTTLTTGGSGDGSIPAGDFLWNYDLVQQPNGAWRIVSAGQG